MLRTRRNLPSSAAFAVFGLFGFFVSLIPAYAVDVTSYNLQKGIELTQSDSAIPTANTNNAFVFEATVNATSSNTVSAASVLPPGGTAKTLATNSLNDQFRYKKKYDSFSKLENAAPDGNYTLTIATVHDGTKTFVIPLQGASYPATIHVLNFGAAQSLDAGSYFVLQWEYLNDGARPDFVQLTIQDSNGKQVFQTPDKGADALNGAFNALLLLRDTLAPNQTYQATVLTRKQVFADSTSYAGANGSASYYRRVAFTIKTLPTLRNADVKIYTVQKMQLYTQSGSNAPVAMVNNGFIFHAQVEASDSNRVTSAGITLSSGLQTNLVVSDSKHLEFEAKLDSVQQLENAFADGIFTLRINTVSEGTKAPGIQLNGSAYPPAPQFSNLDAAQLIDPTQDFTLQWLPFAGAGSLDFVHLQIEDGAGNKVFETGDFAKSSAVSPFRTSQKIQNGTLVAGASYTAKLLFLKVTDLDTTTYPGALGVSGYGRETDVPIRTIGGTSKQPSLSLAAGDAQAVKVTIAGTPGVTYRIEGSPNFQHWLTFATVTLTTDHADWIDTPTSGVFARFYRAVQSAAATPEH